MEARVGIEPTRPLQTRKLFIPRSDKNDENARNAEVRYTAGTRNSSRGRMSQDSHFVSLWQGVQDKVTNQE